MLVKPFSQFIRRSEISHPCMQHRLLFRNAARPEAVHQDSRAIGTACLFVDSLGTNLFGEHGRY